jgi:hypothetical protein
MWLSCFGTLLAQERIISGSVTDPNGAGLAGVSVVVKGTTTGTNTNMDGKYSISASSDAVISFSFIGYTSQEIPVGNQSTIDVVLQEATSRFMWLTVSRWTTRNSEMQAFGEVLTTVMD